MRGAERRRARAAALRARRADRRARRSSAPRASSGRSARATAGARRPRSSSPPEELRAAQRARSAPRRATCCCWSPTTRQVANAVLGQLRLDLAERFGLIAEGANELALDRRLAAVRVERRGGALGPAAPPVHRARRASSTRRTRARRARKAYDVVWNGQEMGGGSIRITRRRRCSEQVFARDRDRRARRPRSASASCSRRCATARRRTAASPTASTGSSQRLLGADSIRDVIAFPKTASGADPLTGAPAPVDEAQLRELGLALRGRPSGRPAS